MKTQRDLLDAWVSYAQVARELARFGVNISGMGVARWAQNDCIPGEYWHGFALACARNGFGDYDDVVRKLARAAHRRAFGGARKR